MKESQSETDGDKDRQFFLIDRGRNWQRERIRNRDGQSERKKKRQIWCERDKLKECHTIQRHRKEE